MEEGAARREHEEQELHDVGEVGHHNGLEPLPQRLDHAAQHHLPAHDVQLLLAVLGRGGRLALTALGRERGGGVVARTGPLHHLEKEGLEAVFVELEDQRLQRLEHGRLHRMRRRRRTGAAPALARAHGGGREHGVAHVKRLEQQAEELHVVEAHVLLDEPRAQELYQVHQRHRARLHYAAAAARQRLLARALERGHHDARRHERDEVVARLPRRVGHVAVALRAHRRGVEEQPQDLGHLRRDEHGDLGHDAVQRQDGALRPQLRLAVEHARLVGLGAPGRRELNRGAQRALEHANQRRDHAVDVVNHHGAAVPHHGRRA